MAPAVDSLDDAEREAIKKKKRKEKRRRKEAEKRELERLALADEEERQRAEAEAEAKAEANAAAAEFGEAGKGRRGADPHENGGESGSDTALNGSDGDGSVGGVGGVGGDDGDSDIDDPSMPVMSMDQLQASSPTGRRRGTSRSALTEEDPLTVPQYDPSPARSEPRANPSGAARRGSSSRNLKTNQRRGSNRGGGRRGVGHGGSGSNVRNPATYEPLLDPTDLDRPGSFTHRDLDTEAGTTIQGLIYVPNKGWCLAHALAALALLVIGGCEIGYGFKIRSSVTTAAYLPYGSCGAWWAGVAIVLTAVIAAVTAATFYNISPRRAGAMEASLCSDPRRYLFVLAGVSMLVAACGAFVDGVYPGVLHLQKLDECSDDTFAKYPGCSVDPSTHGGHACACVDRYVFSASEGHCFDGDDTYGACITCGFNPQASKLKGPQHCVRCDVDYEIDVLKSDCSGYCVPSGTAANPVIGSGCTLATEGDYKCEVFEDVDGSCDAFLPDLIDSLYTSIWLCCAGALVSGLLGILAWASCCSNRCCMDPMILDRDLDPFDNTRDYEMNMRSGSPGSSVGSGSTAPARHSRRSSGVSDPFDLDPFD